LPVALFVVLPVALSVVPAVTLVVVVRLVVPGCGSGVGGLLFVVRSVVCGVALPWLFWWWSGFCAGVVLGCCCVGVWCLCLLPVLGWWVVRVVVGGVLVCVALYFRGDVPESGWWGRPRYRDALVVDYRVESVMEKLVRVKLVGGPEGTPAVWEVGSLEGEGRIRILFGNRYEHFEYAHCSVESDGRMIPVYRWSYRTYVAE
jgi:hypothetical protein